MRPRQDSLIDMAFERAWRRLAANAVVHLETPDVESHLLVRAAPVSGRLVMLAPTSWWESYDLDGEVPTRAIVVDDLFEFRREVVELVGWVTKVLAEEVSSVSDAFAARYATFDLLGVGHEWTLLALEPATIAIGDRCSSIVLDGDEATQFLRS
jgi:hypothetical protein